MNIHEHCLNKKKKKKVYIVNGLKFNFTDAFVFMHVILLKV